MISITVAKKLIPTVPIILISAAYFYQYEYFQHFGINISYYLDVSEILLISAGKIFPALLVWALVYALFFITTSIPEENERADRLAQIQDKDKFLKRFLDYLRVNTWLLILIVFYGILKIILTIFIPEFPLDSFFLWNGCFLFLFVVLREEYKRQHKKYYNKSIDSSITNFVLLLLMLYSQMYFSSVNDFHSKIKSKTFNNFRTKDKVYSCDSINIFIGQTKNYIFIYDKTKKNTMIIKSADVEEQNISTLN